jgi:hypothetical protein
MKRYSLTDTKLQKFEGEEKNIYTRNRNLFTKITLKMIYFHIHFGLCIYVCICMYSFDDA